MEKSMLHIFTKSIFLLLSLVIIVCGIYPFALWVVGQTFFPFQANGSILLDAQNKPIGSKLIAQPFTRNEYFQPRPSAAAYDASASASSALAASNYALRDRVTHTLSSLATYHSGHDVPGDLVTTSASGLDPDITYENAEYQLDRVATQWAKLLNRNPTDLQIEIRKILKSNAASECRCLVGEQFINVLEVNLELQKKYLSSNANTRAS